MNGLPIRFTWVRVDVRRLPFRNRIEGAIRLICSGGFTLTGAEVVSTDGRTGCVDVVALDRAERARRSA